MGYTIGKYYLGEDKLLLIGEDGRPVPNQSSGVYDNSFAGEVATFTVTFYVDGHNIKLADIPRQQKTLGEP